jgi:hypothetical protein
MPNRQTLRFPICPLCSEPVELETTKTNEDGKAVHEECYYEKIKKEKEQES